MPSPCSRFGAALITMLAFLSLARPSRAASCDGFVDVDASASYCAAVTYVKNRGVTVGCTDSSHYCPTDYVTRAQMALYLQRMGLASPTNVLNYDTDALGGGFQNRATGGFSFVGGGRGNVAEQEWSFVGGGSLNDANAEYGTIAGGYQNVIPGVGSIWSTIGGGYGNLASGVASTIPGGATNTASGSYSFAAGLLATADQNACAVFSLWSGTTKGLSCLGTANVFRVGADHGISVDYNVERSDGGGSRWVLIGDVISGQTISTWTGAFLSDGGAWTSVSDRAAKADFVPVDTQAVLQKVAAMPMDTWRYKVESRQRHLGPMAQDFYAAFGLGADDRHITSIDEEGVALAAIQGLNAKGDARDAVIADLARQLQDVKAQLAIVTKRLGAEHAKVSASASSIR